jgi:hypothetical protein
MRQPTYYRQDKSNPRSILHVDRVWVAYALQSISQDSDALIAALDRGEILENSIARFAKHRTALTQKQS